MMNIVMNNYHNHYRHRRKRKAKKKNIIIIALVINIIIINIAPLSQGPEDLKTAIGKRRIQHGRRRRRMYRISVGIGEQALCQGAIKVRILTKGKKRRERERDQVMCLDVCVRCCGLGFVLVFCSFSRSEMISERGITVINRL